MKEYISALIRDMIADWRYYLIAFLTLIGAACFAATLATLQQYRFTASAIFASISVGSFFVLYVCVRYWQHCGNIPSIKDFMDIDDDEI